MAKRKPEDRYTVEDRGFGTPCWIARRTHYRGYGAMWADGKHWRQHRWFYVQKHGPIPHGLELDHLCRVKACCNPDHLEAVTHKENMRRGAVTKLTQEDVLAIHTSTEKTWVLAMRYSIDRTRVWQIRTRGERVQSEDVDVTFP